MTTKAAWNRERFLIALVVAALALRLFRIGVQSLWVDEMLTLLVSNPTKEGLNIWSYLKYNIHGPLHSLFVYLFHFVSMSDGWLRLPSALAGAGAVGYFYLWIRSWLGLNLARIAAVLMVVHPLHIHYSQEVRNYSFLLLFAMIACYYFHRLIKGNRSRDWIWYVAAIALAALSNFTSAFLFATHTVIYFLKNGLRWKPLMRWVAAGLIILVLISPWVYRVYTFIDVTKLVTPVMPGQIDETQRLRGKTTISAAALPYAVYTLGVGFSLGPSTRELHEDTSLVSVVRKHTIVILWVALIIGGLFVWGVREVFRRRMPWLELGLYLLVPIICTFVLNWQNAKAFNIRYVLLSLPPFICVIAAGVVGLRGRVQIAGYALVVLTLLVSTGNYYFDGKYARDDVKGAVRYIEERSATDECILAPTVNDIVQHYLSGDTPVYSVFQRDWLAKEKVDAQLERVFAGCNSFWYLRARPWVDDPNGYVLRQITDRCEKSEAIEFNGVTLIHCRVKKGS